ncbi:MAG: hypothetical protein U1F57_06960 [bacterium]
MPVLAFGADLKHAKILLEDYVAYFSAGNNGGLKGRRFLSLGGLKGKISEKDIQDMVRQYEQGKVDGIVALVSGETKAREVLFHAVKTGKIEAVFSVDALVEGSDLYMFTHQVGARPTFSPIKKGQERGRINRRGPEELTHDGVIASDPPKILFDVIDEYRRHGTPLMPYGLVMGIIGHTEMVPGRLYDLLSGQEAEEADLLGRTGTQPESLASQGPQPLSSSPRPKPTVSRGNVEYIVDWTPLAEGLQEILKKDYAGEIDEMAWDLGEDSHYVGQLLEGRGFREHYWFLRRLATLLYRGDREEFVQLYNQTKGNMDEVVTTADYEILQEALQRVELWEGSVLEKGLKFSGEFPWGNEEIEIARYSLHDLQYRRLSEIQFRSLWRGLALYLQMKGGEAHEERGETAKAAFQKMLQHLFVRQGWTMEADSEQAKILKKARELVAERFGGVLPEDTGIEGVAWQSKNPPLTRWLNEDKIEDPQRSVYQPVYNQVRALLKGLGVSEGETDEKIEAAIFEERGWKREAATAQEGLLLLVRKKVSQRFGGVFPRRPGIEGMALQIGNHSFIRWLKGERIDYSKKNILQSLYGQVRAFLKGLGVSEGETDEKIEAAVFEERGWKREAVTAQEELLLLARKKVAQRFGGVLPRHPGIEGVGQQSEKSALTRWLKEKNIKYKAGTGSNAQYFYAQVGALLKGLGVSEGETDEKIEAAIFEERGWKREAVTAQEELLLLARKKVAQRFGGVLPKDGGGEEVGQQSEQSPLTRWLKGKKVEYSDKCIPRFFYSQVHVLLRSLGVSKRDIDEKIEAAIFEERGWEKEASTAQERLLLLARKKVGQRFGGLLPGRGRSGIEGLPPQHEKLPFTRWLNGKKRDLDKNLVPQIRALLIHENFMSPQEVDQLIGEAK